MRAQWRGATKSKYDTTSSSVLSCTDGFIISAPVKPSDSTKRIFSIAWYADGSRMIVNRGEGGLRWHPRRPRGSAAIRPVSCSSLSEEPAYDI